MDMRRLDELVAEKVMGWQRRWHRKYGGELINGWLWHTPHGWCYRPPEFSRNMAEAWQVVENMRKRGWDRFALMCGATGKWEAVFMQWHGPDYTRVQELADTAPLAICLAALKALGVEVPEQ